MFPTRDGGSAGQWCSDGNGLGFHVQRCARKESISFEAAGIPVRKWVYDVGFTVCLVRQAGPIVHGFLAIATEAHDDDGLPHTLEHLIFLG
eukprot:gene15015-17746_t